MTRNSQKYSLIALLSLSIVVAIFWFLPSFELPKNKNESNQIVPNHSTKNLVVTGFSDKKSTDNTPKSFKEWCQIDYQDLSRDSIFTEFQLWLKKFESLDGEPANEKLRNVLLEGEKLSQKRAKVLQKIIRGDPQKAIQIALSPKELKTLPAEIQKNMERWESDFADVKAMHVCFDPKHPGGYINRTATMQDGRKLRAWVFGKRKNLPTISGLAVWGISIRDDFAISDKPIENSSTAEKKSIRLGGIDYSYSNAEELALFQHEVQASERRSYLHRIPVRYPRIAFSSGLTDYYERKYDLIVNPSNWQKAKKAAEDNNGTLVIINSQLENRFIRSLLDQDQENYPGYDDSNNTIDMVWIGATDFEDENSSYYDIENNASRNIELNATEGDWKWLDGTDVSNSAYVNWFNNQEPNSSEDYAAMDWSTPGGTWVDVNASYRLPFVIEYQLENEPTPVTTPIDGHRKVLVVPARFSDEGLNYRGSTGPLVDEFGNPIYSEIQQDAYEPVSQENLAEVMKQVKDFYLRNSDGTFHLDAVITPTVTIPFYKYNAVYGTGSPNLFDSSGNFIERATWIHDAEDEMIFAGFAAEEVAKMDEAWDWDGPAYMGVVEVTISSIPNPQAYETPPIISFSGGNRDPADNNQIRQRFEPAKAEAITDGQGRIVGIKVLNSGSYYFSAPELLVNGAESQDYSFSVRLDNTCVSYVGITTNNQSGAAGVGFVGNPGSHVDAVNGNVSATTIVHELGHNFGLLHANRLVTKSERPNSDESDLIDYGNPYSVMGTASINNGGDLTIAEKVITKSAGNFGLTYGTSQGVDVAHILTLTEWTNSPFRKGAVDGLPENSFRIYRHDYQDGPLALKPESFDVFIPQNDLDSSLLQIDTNYSLSFIGTGEGASGKLKLVTPYTGGPNAELTIENPGSGFSSEPKVVVVDEHNATRLALDSSWIQKLNGYGPSFESVELRDDGNESNRGIRGLHLKASSFSPKGMDYEDENLDAFWLSYRRSASQFGLSVLNGNIENPENFLIDISVNTPDDFSDAFLLLGHTFSDYDSDVHITPFKQGGTYPMEYIDVVVNKGTVNAGASAAPVFTIKVSNKNPAIGEYIQISAQVTDNNTSGYSYAWFTDEVMESEVEFLNQPSILKSFSRSGQFVIRVVVSDLKGGISSRNVVVQVGEYEKSFLSSISGTVRANEGFIEGARVAISPASVTEHTVGITGTSNDSHIPSATNSPATFLIDGMSAPNLTVRRGEIHRFYFDANTEGFPISFLEHPEHEVPRVRLNMLVSPIVDVLGNKYSNPPLVAVDEISSFATYFSNNKGTAKVGTINDFYAGFLEQASNANLFITRPFAKSLLMDTEVETIFIRPTELDIDGNYIKFGGKGHDRDNPPEVTIYRSSLWENYQDTNATAKAYVDGVGTITPVTSLDFYDTIWETRAASDPIPELVVWGSGGNQARPYINQTNEEESTDSNETHATVSVYVDTQNRNIPYRTIAISDQGILFEPDSTMAVLQYPLDPIAYWTFDRHESLFEEAASGRYQPSPAWNAMQIGTTDIFPYDLKLTQYWSFDEESNTSIYSSKGGIISIPFDLSDGNRSHWGVKGRAVRLSGADSLSIGSVASTSSLSMWLRPEGNFTFNLGGESIAYDHANRTCSYHDATPITRRTTSYDWMHVAIVNNDTNSSFYIDGMSSSVSANGGALSTTNFVGLLDETHIFSVALSEAEVKILGGRTFLDLSGNKIHAAPIGPDFNMSSPDNIGTGLSSDRPSTTSHASPRGAKSPSFGYKLGDSYLGEDHGRSLYFDDNDSYIDVSPHAFYFAGEDRGSISFWLKTSGRDLNGGVADQNIFTASCLEDNASFFRIMIRDTGVMQLHAVNDGTEVSKFRTESSSSSRVNDNQWHHITLVSDGEKSAFWIDGKQVASRPYEENGDKSAFFSDIENVDFVAIGSSFFNTDNNNTENFLGNIDDFYIYNRALNSTEINYLYDLRKGREQLPRLEAVVDAVGSIKITSSGSGYKETPDVVLSYGQEGNSTSELTTVADQTALTAIISPTDGQLVYVSEEGKVYSYHEVSNFNRTDWRHDDLNNGWVEYQLAYGLAGLNNDSPKGRVDQILWTKDMTKLVPVTLPDGRVVNRQFLEYVVKGDGIFPALSGDYGAPHGLFGYTAPPNLYIASPKITEEGGEKNATAHALFFADLYHTAEITNPGHGLTSFGFEANQSLRISGKGYRPDQYEIIARNGVFSTTYELVETAYAEYWGQDKDGNYTFEPTTQFDNDLSWVRLSGHFKPTASLTSFPTGSSVNLFDLNFGLGSVPEAIFSDWTHQPGIGEPRNVLLDFNQTLSHVSLNHSGFGYSMPAKVRLVGGFSAGVEYPNWVAQNQTSYSFTPAEFQIGSVDGNGSILSITRTSSGTGYVEAPRVVISGGGGFGAEAEAVLDGTGGIASITVENGGRGYFNIDTNNAPSANLVQAPALFGSELDANLSVRLGGYLGEMGRCSACVSGDHAHKENRFSSKFYHHLDAWVEIWDRNRTEEEIDENGDRALASAKIRNGVIEKVVVIKSGRGYIDPIVRVRGTPPHHNHFTDMKLHKDYGVWGSNRNRIPSDKVTRHWRCVNPREDKVGNLIECGHIFEGQYPPEQCPGEVDEDFPLGEASTSQAITDWLTRHIPSGDHPHQHCDASYYGYDNSKHLTANFRSRRCGGTKANFVLLNDLYRTPYENWEPFDANLSALVEGGRIQEIVVLNGGSMYAASEVFAEGSGTGVDAIPIYDERGENVRVIYDDSRLKNLEYDFQVTVPSFLKLKQGEAGRVVLDYNVFLPDGAGQGFQERPWSWDWLGSNNPTYGPREKVLARTVKSEEVSEIFFTEDAVNWSFGAPQLLDNLGDRIMDVRVDDTGLFDSNRVIQDVLITFSSSHLPDVDRDGLLDFIPASAKATGTFKLTSFQLDENGTFQHGDRNQARSLYVEEPVVNIIPQLLTIDAETSSSFFRLNGQVDYDTQRERTYFDLYVDDQLPSKFYYGFGSNADGLPAMGGEIIVTEGLPAMNWGKNEPLERNMTTYTDQNGYYFIPNLEPGLYNVGVFLEDRKFQDSTFRPDSNITRVSDILYVPGFPELLLETDNRGAGVSRLIWSSDSRKLSRPDANNLTIAGQTESEYEQKTLEGIGGGFRQGEVPELIILPSPMNSNDILPNITVNVLMNGTLKLEIIDDENTTAYNPDDRFTIGYSSNVQGVNFREFYQFSESNKSNWGGSGDSELTGTAWMEIFPNDSNGLGVLEVPLETSQTGSNPFEFELRAYEANGNQLDTSGAQWNLVLTFDPPEQNQTLVAELSQTTGSTTSLSLTSTLRGSGIVDFDVLSPGTLYQGGSQSKIVLSGEPRGFEGTLLVNADGNVTGVQVLNSGSGYTPEDSVMIEDGNGSSARLAPILGGKLYLDANLTTPSGQVLQSRTRVFASTRNHLSEDEKWLDLYFDSIQDRNSTWWSSDPDGDNLTNFQEKVYGTHPLKNDTDGDLLTDDLEISYQTNPHQLDTDGDGLTDYNETVGDPYAINGSDGTDPRKFDTDRDGMADGFEDYLKNEGIDVSPVQANTQGKTLGGYIFNLNEYSGNLYIKVKVMSASDPSEVTEDYAVPWIPKSDSYPILYTFENLPMENNASEPITYQVSVFLDTYPKISPNGSYDKGEPSAFWEGTLTANTFSANLFLQEEPPDIYFSSSNHQQITLPDPSSGTFSFPLSITAWDLLDGYWDLNSTSPEINITNETMGSFLTLDKPNLMATVDRSIPLGTYTISYQATDSSGSQSKVLSQTIIVDDTKGPVFTLLGENPYPFPYGTTWEDPGWLVSDNRDENSTIKVTISDPPATDTVGTYTLTYLATDRAGNSTTKQRVVQIVDTVAPTIVVSDSLLLVSKGQGFTLPTYSASDNLEGDLTSAVTISGASDVDVNVVGDYQIQFSVSDSSGNQGQLSVIIRVEPPAYAINGNAIDGYLVGAKVIFDADGDGQSDLSSTSYTQENGEFSLSFSQEEMKLFDLNANGILDSNEGRIIVSGGVDSSTNQPFAGTLLADPNASVVTPLTSLISGLMDTGLAKSDAEQLLSNNFSLSQEVDLTSYDPYENAAKGESTSGDILVAGARVATLMKQTEAFVRLLKGASYTSGEASIALTTILATKLKENQNSMVNPLDDGIAEILTSVVNDQVPSNLYTSEEVADFVQIIQVSDSLHKTLINSDKSPASVASEITKQQLAVNQSVLDELEGIENLQSVSSTISLQTLQNSSETFLEVNLFSPTAENFTFILDDTSLHSNQEIVSLGAVDLDGDPVSYSILSGNVDTDGDGIDFVRINQSGNLVLQDAAEINNLTSQTLSLSISLSDSRGKNKTIIGKVMVDNALAMESNPTSVNSWMNSSWLGNFHKTGGPWVFHEKLAWQYLYKLSTGGYWFWDKEDSFWWWSSPETFPYAFDHSSNSWIFFDLDSNQVKIYNFNDEIWRVR